MTVIFLAGQSYFPTWMEITITFSIVTVGFVIFSLAVKYFPIFKNETAETDEIKIPSFIDDLQIVAKQNYNPIMD